MPTIKVRATPVIHTSNVNHDGLIESPSTDLNIVNDAIEYSTNPAPVQNRGIPT
jgi:hypothetical protein